MDEDDDWDFDGVKAEWNKKREAPFDFEQWCKDLDEHPAFMTKLPSEGQYSEAVEAIQAMKYDCDSTPEEQAASFKADGNVQFKHKNYQKAILAYTEGIKLRCSDQKLNADLHNNRSATHFYLSNYRSSFKDCLFVRRFDPGHLKAFKRGIECLTKLNCPIEILKWIDETDSSILDTLPDVHKVRSSALRSAKLLEKEKRQKEIHRRKLDIERRDLIDCFKLRNLAFKDLSNNQLDQLDLKHLEIDLPQCSTTLRVFLNPETKVLVWPVLFLYPEYNTTDFVERFDENSTFLDHFNVLLSETPTWDSAGSYTIDRLEVFYESSHHPDSLVMVPLFGTLKSILSQSSYRIVKGLPSFIILARDTEFRTQYASRFKIES